MTTEAFPFRHRFTEAVPLARGAEGRLLRVRDNWTGRWGALKVSVDASARQGLLEEFRWLSHLRHPCLIESHDLLEEDGERAHLLEYLPAVDPFRLWEDGGEEAVWAASTQTLRALAYLHRHGVVHGDVTPGNILVWREGSGWRAKLADLGLALPEASAAKAGVRGTPGYWSPEIAAGKGATPASDFYSLAASMYAWIEGRRPWSDLAPAEELRHLASMPDLPKPRRRISPELESFLAVLGSSRAEARSRWDWAELRSRTAAWGPPAIVATVSGLEAPVSEWKAWVHAVPMGSAAALVLSGRLGTGRRTALYALARALATEGWMTLWSSPMGVLHDRFAEAGSDLDPVVAARELGNRCAGRHLAFLWSDRATDLESRILRAFVAAREDASSNVRTLVLRAAGIEGSDEVVEWLRGTARCRADAWRGLDAEALRAISADLFAPEEGFVRRGESIETPLTLVAMKQAAVQGTGVGEAGAETHSEMERLWK
ncbi:MAG TPA: protein kinase, partial [Candidatus Eisenbacteria bacterium]|nr:protein kinase [Candidatus Eisenbacteria bacterium]